MKVLITSLFLLIVISSTAQNVTITPNGITPASGGIQKMTYDQILAISDPEIGDLVIDISNKTLRMWNGTEWSYFLSALSKNNVILSGFGIVGDSLEYVTALDFDSNNNRYITGVFNGSAIFGTDTLNNSEALYTTFLAKQNSEGQFQWVKTSTGAGALIPWKMRVDSNDNIFLVGELTGEVTLWDAGGTLTSNGEADVFVVKLNDSGVPIWDKVLGGSDYDSPVAIDFDASDNLVIAGTFESTTNFDGNSLTSLGAKDAFIARLNNNNGSITFLKQLGNIGTDRVFDIKVNSQGHYVFGGEYNNALTAGGFSLPAPSVGNSNFYLFKLNPITNSYVEGLGFGNSHSASGTLVLDEDDNIYFSGTTKDSLKTGNYKTEFPGYSRSKIEPEIAFIIKLTTDFEHEDLIFFEGNSLASIKMAMNSEGNIMSSFLSNAHIRVGNTAYFSNNSSKTIIGEIDPHQGVLIWADEVVGQSNVLDITMDASGNTWIGGINGGDIRFGNTHIIAPENFFKDSGQIDAFVIKVVK